MEQTSVRSTQSATSKLLPSGIFYIEVRKVLEFVPQTAPFPLVVIPDSSGLTQFGYYDKMVMLSITQPQLLTDGS